MQEEQMLEEILRKCVCKKVYSLQISSESNFAMGSSCFERSVSIRVSGVIQDAAAETAATSLQQTM